MNYSRSIPMYTDRRLPQVQTRRVALNLATRVLTVGLAAVVLIGTGKGVVANPLTEIQLVTSMSATGQQQGSLLEKRKQGELLQQARAAMQQGDLAKAEELIERSKAFNVPATSAYSEDDTPEKATKALMELKAVKSNPDYLGQKLMGQSPDMSQQMAAEALARGKAALESGQRGAAMNYYELALKHGGPDFRGSQYSVAAFRHDLEQAGLQTSIAADGASANPGMARLPQVNNEPAAPATTNNPYSAAVNAQGNADTARRLLLQARVELAKGNVALAEKLVGQVKALGLVYPLTKIRLTMSIT